MAKDEKRMRVLLEEESVNPLQYAAMVFLHRELAAKGQVLLTQHDFDIYALAVQDGKSGVQITTNAREDIILAPVKARSDG